MKIHLFFIFFLSILTQLIHAQKRPSAKDKALIYVDKNGVMRWTGNNAEAAFFGANYTTPFAFAYRAHKALNVDPEQAIKEDVYHFSRLGLDAFRVHMWDTEISDSLGNLLQNDHLRLFDFLLAELKKRNIKTIITPIAFWGNGYPERDERTPGFSRVYGKGRATTNDTAIRAQENYITQLFKHVNPYTNLTYGDDPHIIAAEINNEPSHSGPKAGVTSYINRLAAALRSTGWTKPVFYNISQNPWYADAVAAAKVDGFSFQWYPSGLVAGRTLNGNLLPNVDKYAIPFDTIPAFRKKALMVYEFDAADIFQSNMYPAMAKSFRGAGFQWATQFAYDPMHLANVNTEYQTHYVNLAYTPCKAISLMIASKVFHTVPRFKNYGAYPRDSVFDAFRLSYKEDLSEMNTPTEFYYSNSTGTSPVQAAALQHVAGVGTSQVVQYTGTGAYFLDKVEDGIWRLEVMPDAIHIRDPFERASPRKEVTRIRWAQQTMSIRIPDLGNGYALTALNEGNGFSMMSVPDSFPVRPGTYLLARKGKPLSTSKEKVGALMMNEFVAPRVQNKHEIFLRHEPVRELSAGNPASIHAIISGIDSADVYMMVSRPAGFGQPRRIPMRNAHGYDYVAEVPADLLTPGLINYRIIVQQGDEYTVYPGGWNTNPFAWDTYQNETWETLVAAENGGLGIYNPTSDRNAVIYPSFRRNFQASYITGETSGRLILRLAATELSGDHIMGFVHFFGDKLKSRRAILDNMNRLLIRARATGNETVTAKIILTDVNAQSFSTTISLTDTFRDIEVPLSNLSPDSSMLMPRPYPGFQPLWFNSSSPGTSFRLADAEKISVFVGGDLPQSAWTKPYSVEVESMWLEKRK